MSRHCSRDCLRLLTSCHTQNCWWTAAMTFVNLSVLCRILWCVMLWWISPRRFAQILLAYEMLAAEICLLNVQGPHSIIQNFCACAYARQKMCGWNSWCACMSLCACFVHATIYRSCAHWMFVGFNVRVCSCVHVVHMLSCATCVCSDWWPNISCMCVQSCTCWLRALVSMCARTECLWTMLYLCM